MNGLLFKYILASSDEEHYKFNNDGFLKWKINMLYYCLLYFPLSVLKVFFSLCLCVCDSFFKKFISGLYHYYHQLDKAKLAPLIGKARILSSFMKAQWLKIVAAEFRMISFRDITQIEVRFS